MKTKKLQENVSGAYPELTTSQEAFSALLTLAFFVLPIAFAYFRMQLTKPQVREFAQKVVNTVKSDNSNESLKLKTVRAINTMLQRLSSKNVSIEKELNILIPDNLERKNEDEISNEVKRRSLGLKNTNVPVGFRG
jgi:hypothetical protein